MMAVEPMPNADMHCTAAWLCLTSLMDADLVVHTSLKYSTTLPCSNLDNRFHFTFEESLFCITSITSLKSVAISIIPTPTSCYGL